jgi:hypothetical protein
MNAGFLAEGSGMLGIDIRMSSVGRQSLARTKKNYVAREEQEDDPHRVVQSRRYELVIYLLAPIRRVMLDRSASFRVT